MIIYSKLKHQYRDLLNDSIEPIVQARIRILAFGLALLLMLATGIMVLLSAYPFNLVLVVRLVLFLLSMIFALYLLFFKKKWKASGHILLCSLSLYVWANLTLYQNGINLVTFQLILIILSTSFYILGKNWGIIYSLGTVIPLLIRLLFFKVQEGNVFITNAQANRSTFLLALSVNFLLLIVMHREFFKSFYLCQDKERELNTQLQSALKEAQEATKMRTNFLSSMSHELRTPLHAVIGMTNILSIENPRQDQEENLAILRFSAENLLALINDTLDFSKMNEDKIVLNKSEFNLNLLLQNIYAAFHTKVEQKEISFELKTDFEHTILHVIGDQIRLIQILNNLVSNAIKFTDAGGLVEITVKTVNRDEENISLLFIIRDNGIGIPENKQDIIFEPFLQANNNITKRYGGTGLGLSIVKRLVGLHNAELKLQSEENVGSTFSFELSYELAKKQEPEYSHLTSTSVIDVRNLNILIAEDNIINIMVLKKILDQWDCTYSITKNGLEALEMVKTGNFDVVLMDIHMPVMDGFEASRKIREIPELKISKIKIIALTASSDVDIQQSFSYSYLDDYLTKPFSPALLKEKLEKLTHIF